MLLGVFQVFRGAIGNMNDGQVRQARNQGARSDHLVIRVRSDQQRPRARFQA